MQITIVTWMRGPHILELIESCWAVSAGLLRHASALGTRLLRVFVQDASTPPTDSCWLEWPGPRDRGSVDWGLRVWMALIQLEGNLGDPRVWGLAQGLGGFN